MTAGMLLFAGIPLVMAAGFLLWLLGILGVVHTDMWRTNTVFLYAVLLALVFGAAFLFSIVRGYSKHVS